MGTSNERLRLEPSRAVFCIVAMSMKELAIGLLVGTLLCQRLDVVDLADLVHGLKQASTPSTPSALPFEQECLVGG